MGQPWATLFPTLTRVKCDCPLCDGAEYVDEVGLMLVEDAIRAYVGELRAKAAQFDSALADAQRIMDDELAKGR